MLSLPGSKNKSRKSGKNLCEETTLGIKMAFINLLGYKIQTILFTITTKLLWIRYMSEQ